MNCTHLPPLTSDQLSAAVDGDAPANVLDHLAQCPYCAGRFADAQTVENQLNVHLHRWQCPPSQQLTDFHFNLLDPEIAAAVSTHVTGCVRCQAELDALSRFLAPEAAPEAEVRPRETREPHAPRVPLGISLREIIAQLLPRTPALALRGEVKAPFMAQAGDVLIVVDVQGAGAAGFSLMGQLAAPNQDQWTGALVLLHRDGDILQSTTVDDLGHFRLTGVGPGALSLRIAPPQGATIRLPSVDIGDQGQWTLSAT